MLRISTLCVIGILLFILLSTTKIKENLRNSPKSRFNREVKPRTTGETKPKKILLWSPYWGSYGPTWDRIFYRIVSEQCPVSNCHFVYDKRLINQSDAVLFHVNDLPPSYILPKIHPPNQPWILFGIESPSVILGIRKMDTSKLDGIFNWTMTYRRDSDIVIPYGQVVPLDNKTENTEKINYWNEKQKYQKTAAWMVSHCGTDGKREVYVRELIKHMHVDVYGNCGHKKCGKRLSIRRVGEVSEDICDELLEQYFFYFAFENSICEDYVTEKLYKTLALDVVPVVFGGADYSAFAPPGSYINAMDYPNPKLLAEHLLFIASNEKLYNKFFEWKNHYRVVSGHPFLPLSCDLCAKLHGEPVQFEPTTLLTKTDKRGIKTRIQGKKYGVYPKMKNWLMDGGACRRWVNNEVYMIWN